MTVGESDGVSEGRGITCSVCVSDIVGAGCIDCSDCIDCIVCIACTVGDAVPECIACALADTDPESIKVYVGIIDEVYVTSDNFVGLAAAVAVTFVLMTVPGPVAPPVFGFVCWLLTVRQ